MRSFASASGWRSSGMRHWSVQRSSRTAGLFMLLTRAHLLQRRNTVSMSQLKPMWMLREGSAGKVHPFSNKHSFLAKRCSETIFPVPKIQQFMFTKELFPPALKQNKFQWLLGEWTSAQGVSTSFCSCCCPSTAWTIRRTKPFWCTGSSIRIQAPRFPSCLFGPIACWIWDHDLRGARGRPDDSAAWAFWQSTVVYLGGLWPRCLHQIFAGIYSFGNSR